MQPLQRFDEAREGAVPGCARRLAGPGEDAHACSRLGRQQGIERVRLCWLDPSADLMRDVALRGGERGRGQLFDDRGAGHDELAPAGLLHQRRGDRHRAGRGERHGQQPCRQSRRRAGMRSTKPNASRSSSRWTERVWARVVGGDRLRSGADLVGHEAQRRLRDHLAGPQLSAGVAQHAELRREAESVVVTPALLDRGEVGVAERRASSASVVGRASNPASCAPVSARRLGMTDCPRKGIDCLVRS